MSDIAEFLLARIAEDERAAGGLQYDALVAQLSSPPLVMTLLGPYLARFDPARVLAECEAKRRIVELHQGAENALAIISAISDPEPIALGIVRATVAVTTAVVQLHAATHAGHPDYDESWRL